MKNLFLVPVLFCFGCATTHPGTGARSLTPGGDSLKISADPVKEYSDKSNIFLDFTIENTGHRWIKVDQVMIEFPNESGVVHNIIVGDDLKTWAESYANKRRQSEHNADLGAAALVLGGLSVALIGVGTGDRDLAKTGLAASAGGSLWKASRDAQGSRERAIRSTLVPDSYLLAPITIPSQGHLRRWVLVNIPDGLIAKRALLTLKTVEGETLRYEVPIVFKGGSI